MKLKTLLKLVAEANPKWEIKRPAGPDSKMPTDGCLGQIDGERIDVWRFGDSTDMEDMSKKVNALMAYICIACNELPEVADALQGMLEVFCDDKDCEDLETVKNARRVMKKLNSIKLCQKQ